jgi:5'-3' exonuclease
LPESIPDYLAPVGDTADGIPGVPRQGAKSSARILRRYGHVENIPDNLLLRDVAVRGGTTVAESTYDRPEKAMPYKRLATLRLDTPIQETLVDINWRGARHRAFYALCEHLGFNRLKEAPRKWAEL